MSQCKQSASEFIQNTFSPHIAVLCSNDAQLLCEKNNLSFVQLIQPFCRLSSEVHIRDANNVTHSIHNLRISACDMGTQLPQQAVIKKQLNDAVASTCSSQELGANNTMSVGDYDLQLSPATPWFESWREAFLQVLPPSDHEYLNHCLACIFVVASTNSDPLSTFTALANQQVTQQQQFPNRLPRWFCQGVLHYYVLLHDVLDGEQTRAEALYQSMKATFGVQICHLLQINSRSINTLESLSKSGLSVQPDPWSQFLNKPVHPLINSESIDSDHVSVESCSFPTQLIVDENSDHPPSNPLSNSFHENNVEESGSSGMTSSSSCDRFSHPLASPITPPSRDTPSPDDPTAAAGGYQGEYKTFSFEHHGSHNRNLNKSHGMCLTPSDLDRLRIFMHEFVVRALIPWAERQMKMLSEQLTSRKGIHRSIFSGAKKWFGNKPQGAIPASQNTTVVYTKDAPELQLRRLGDLAFLFQMYEFAYNTYHTAKKDFNNDQAWLHFAGALEMASLAVFLQGPSNQRQYPRHYMETAISTYLTSCRNPQYATRSTLTSSEALKKIGMYSEAAMQLIKMTSEDSDLTSALFLEQAAHCFLALKTPMVRKYSFHMILAGHRFSKAGQRKHSLRSYSQALQIYKGKNWSIAEDHINFTIGRQSVNLKQLESATAAFKHLLTEQSKQPTSQQAAFLREYLFVYKQLLSQEERDNSSYGHLPELPLPLVYSNASKVLLGPPSQQENNTRKTKATGMWFSDEEHATKWNVLEEQMMTALGSFYKPNPQLFTDNTDNRSSPIAFVEEPISIELQVENPLHVMLVLSDVSLLWTFIPSITGPDPPQVISNEITTGVKNSLADEIVHTSVIKEVIVQGIQNEKIHLTLTPKQPGQLRIVGLAYNLGTSSLAQNSSLQQEVGSSSLTASTKPSYTSSVFVRGKQKLEPQGCRLNNTQEARQQKLYSPDRRLDLLIHEEMPSLGVIFSDFPENLLCGEVQCIEIEFINTGKSPLHNLYVASSHPQFFTFGRNSELPKYPYVYQMRAPQCSSLSSTLTSTIPDPSTFLSLPDILNIPLPKGVLEPGDTLSMPLWLRGDDIGGVHDVDFLFYYEPVNHSSNIRHRVVRHCATINTVDSLSVRTTVTRPSAIVGSIRGQELNSCIFSCELENLSQVQIQRPHVQELQVTQVSCASPCWTLISLGAKQQSGVRLGSRETLQMVVKGLKQEQDNESKKLIFSEMAFDRDQVNSACSPCSDFFVRSSLCHKKTSGETQLGKESSLDTMPATGANVNENFAELETAVMLKLTLIFLWKAYVVQESGQMKIVVGQHHVHVNRFNTCALSYTAPSTAVSRPPLRFIKNEDQEKKTSPSSEVTTSLVTYSFTHTYQKEHKFSKGLCVIPVSLVLQNHSDLEVYVVVDTSKTPESLSSGGTLVQEASAFPTKLPSASSSHCVRWIGLTQATLTLSKGQNTVVSLKAGFTHPGTYNMNNISVFVTYSSDKSHMVLQKHLTPSIITLVDAS